MTDAELLTLLMQLQGGGLTQEQTASLLGMTQPGVNRVLSGKSKLSSTGRAFVLYLLHEVKVNAPWRIAIESFGNQPTRWLRRDHEANATPRTTTRRRRPPTRMPNNSP